MKMKEITKEISNGRSKLLRKLTKLSPLPLSFLKLVSQKKFARVVHRLNSRRPHVRVSSTLRSASLRTAIAAGKEADQNRAESYNAIDDCCDNPADSSYDCHDHVPNGLEA